MIKDNSTMDIFSIPVDQLHRAGQHTSQAALLKTEKSRDTMQRRVFQTIVKYGDIGAIPEQVTEDMGIDLIDVRRAFSVLKKLGKIVPTGAERNNPKGHACEVWKANYAA